MKAEKTRKILLTIREQNKTYLEVGKKSYCNNLAYISNAENELAELEILAEIGEAFVFAFNHEEDPLGYVCTIQDVVEWYRLRQFKPTT